MLPTSHKRAITDLIRKIEDSTFEASDIKLLLIDIRELVDQRSFTKELAHFIAHPKRDKGLCYEYLNLNSLVLRRSAPGGPLLAPVELLEIKKEMFDLIFMAGLKRWKKVEFPAGKNTKKSDESSVRAYIMNAYEYDKKKNAYTLKHPKDLRGVFSVINKCLGFVSAGFVSSKEIINTLNNDIKSIYKKYIPGNQYKDSILNKANEIILCIFILFQDSQFKMLDNSEGRFTLGYSLSPENEIDYEKRKFNTKNGHEIVRQIRLENIKESYLELNTAFRFEKATMLFNFIDSELRVADYVDNQVIEEYVGKLATMPPRTTHTDFSEDLLSDIRVARDATGKLRIIKN